MSTVDGVDAMVLGANGQDGRWLTRFLTGRGEKVLAVGRQAQSALPPVPTLSYRRLDLRDTAALRGLLREARPRRVFHLAAVHGSAALSGGGGYEPVFDAMLDVNVKSLHAVLEHMRQDDPSARLLYASSGKVFGTPPPPVVSERSPRHSACLYTLTKNASADLIAYYRAQHSLLAGVVFLFNHESEYRPAGYFVPKLVAALRAAQAGNGGPAEFATLDFYCDWGSAEEYMEIAAELLDKAPGEDVVVATGRPVYARELVRQAFSTRGLDGERHVVEVRRAARPVPNAYEVDLSRLRELLGRAPRRRIEEMVVALLGEHG